MRILKSSPFALLLAALAVSLSSICPATAEQVPPRIVDWSLPFHHPQTGIIVPEVIEGVSVQELALYEGDLDLSEDLSLRYNVEEKKIDTYFYRKSPQLDGQDEARVLAQGELVRAISAVKANSGDTGFYGELDVPDRIIAREFREGGLAMAECTLSFRPRRDDQLGEPMESTIAVLSVDDYFVKLRYSVPLGDGSDAQAAQREERKAFLEALIYFVLETPVREEVMDAIETLRVDPEDEFAGAVVYTYTESSKLVHVNLDKRLVPFIADDEFAQRQSLLIAYIAGNISAQFDGGPFVSRDVAGVEMMLQSYQKLREAEACPPRPQLDEWLERLAAGNLEEVLTSPE